MKTTVLDKDRIPRYIAAGALAASGPMLISGRGMFFALLGIGAVAGLIAQHARITDIVRSLTRSLKSPLGLAIICLLALMAVPTVRSIDPSGSLIVFGRVAAALTFIALLVHGLAGDGEGRRFAMKTLVVFGPVAALAAIAGLTIWPSLFEVIRLYVPGEDYALQRLLKPYGAAVAIMAPVVVWASIRLGGGWIILGLFYVPLAIWMAWIVGNKSAVLGGVGAVGGVIVCLVFSRLSATAARFSAAGLLVLIVAALTLVFSRLPAYPWTAESAAGWPVWMIDLHRQIIWSFVLERAGDNPLLGWGLGTTGRLPGAREAIPTLSPAIYAASHPHNWVLQVLVEGGALVLAIITLVILQAARHIVRLAVAGATAAYAVAAVLGAFLASSLVNFSFFAMWWQLLLMLMMALPLSVAWHETGYRAKQER